MKRGSALLACILSGVAVSFAFPEADLAPIAWVGLIPLFAASSGGSARRGAVLGYAFGVGYFGSVLIWIHLIGWLPWGLLTLLQAVFIAPVGGAWAVATRRLGAPGRIVAAPALWVAADFLRSLIPYGGFTFGQLVQTQHDLGWLLRPAAFGGGWLVTAIIVAVNVCLLEAGRAARAGERRPAVAIAATVTGFLLLGLPAFIPSSDATGVPAKVAIVQGNVPQDFTGSSFEKDVAITRSHQSLTRKLTGQGIGLVVWPESSVGIDLVRVSDIGDMVFEAARAVGAPMIVGANLEAGPNRYKVMALEISPEGEISDRYQKTHLVPFGEYVPGRRFLDWIPLLDQVPRDAVPGDRPHVFDVAGGKLATVISYEGDFGSLVRRPVAEGGRLLVVATNTSTWGYTWASAQHVAFSQVRAVENGVWVVHAALSGISAFVAPDGRVVDELPLWTAGSMIHEVQFARGETFYTRVGDWFPIACILVSIVVVARGSLVRRKTVRRIVVAPQSPSSDRRGTTA